MAKPGPKPRPVRDRFMEKVAPDPMSGCWLWTGKMLPQGYGVLSVEGTTRGAHRLAHELFIGPIPEGMHIDHLCRNRACCSPDHIEAVTPRENLRRGIAPSWVSYRTNRCHNGHELNEQNAYITAEGRRACRPCRAAWMRAYNRKRKAAA